jgi:hypothetical protein
MQNSDCNVQGAGRSTLSLVCFLAKGDINNVLPGIIAVYPKISPVFTCVVLSPYTSTAVHCPLCFGGLA